MKLREENMGKYEEAKVRRKNNRRKHKGRKRERVHHGKKLEHSNGRALSCTREQGNGIKVEVRQKRHTGGNYRR